MLAQYFYNLYLQHNNVRKYTSMLWIYLVWKSLFYNNFLFNGIFNRGSLFQVHISEIQTLGKFLPARR